MRLVLIRHGDSLHAQQGRIADIAGCEGLTELGIAQAGALRRRLETTGELRGCAACLTSPVTRARQTAELLALALDGVPTIEEPDLREVLPGAADGLTWAEYAAAYGAFDLVAEPERPFAPQGESWAAFLARVRGLLERLASQYAGQTVLAVTHAGFIVASLLTTFAIPRPGTRARLEPRHTALTAWELAPGGAWQLERYNDAWHLDWPAADA